jgi:hypothetical protein
MVLLYWYETAFLKPWNESEEHLRYGLLFIMRIILNVSLVLALVFEGLKNFLSYRTAAARP